MSRLAASIALVRGAGEALEVFWMRRADEVFLSGYHAFPGGFVEAGDAAIPVLGALSAEERQARAAAVRELFEETGCLLISGIDAPGLLISGTHADQTLAAACAEATAAIDGEALLPIGRWAAPPYLGRPFEARFYLAWAPPGASPIIRPGDREHSEGAWVRPAQALRAWADGRVLLAPPTLGILRALAEGGPPTTERFTRAPEARGALSRWAPIRPHVTLFPQRTPTLPPATHTNAYLVGRRRLVVIDPASPHPQERAALDSHLDELAGQGRRVEAVLLTHHHPDHVGGAAHLARRLGVPIAAHPAAADRLPFALDRLLGDGDRVPFTDVGLRALHTPGHAVDHLCYLEEETGCLVAGDMVTAVGSILIEPEGGSMADYLRSLRRLRDEVRPAALLPAHGPVIGGARARLSHHIEHRLEREDRVAAALAEGALTLEAMLPHAYADVPTALWPLARQSLRAHLLKLVAEGRATGDEAAGWRPC